MDREYSVKYATRRDVSPDGSRYGGGRRAPPPPRAYKYDYDYDYDDRKYSRGYEYRDDRDRRPTLTPPGARSAKTTTYEVARDRYDEPYAKRSNVVVLDRPPRSNFEVLMPSRQTDGTYVVDLARGGHDDGRSGVVMAPSRGRYYEYEVPPSRDPRAADREVVMYARRARADSSGLGGGGGRAPPTTVNEAAATATVGTAARSAMRGGNHTPPQEHARRQRSQSVGFYRDQIAEHDVTQRRHERPGAEAHLAGRYLNHYDDDSYMDLDHEPQPRRRQQRRDRDRDGDREREEHPDHIDEERRMYTEETVRQYDSEAVRRVEDTDSFVSSRDRDRERKRSRSRRPRHHHHHDDDDRYRHEDVVETRKYTKYYDD